jgi:hypothetical protein
VLLQASLKAFLQVFGVPSPAAKAVSCRYPGCVGVGEVLRVKRVDVSDIYGLYGHLYVFGILWVGLQFFGRL